MEVQWNLWAPFEETLEKVDSYKSFLMQVGTLFGRKIVTFAFFVDECQMYRRYGDWKELLRAIFQSIPNHVRMEMLHEKTVIHNIEAYEILLQTTETIRYTVKAAQSRLDPIRIVEFMGDFFYSKSTFWTALVEYKHAACLPRPIWLRIVAFLRVCKRYHVPKDLKQLLVYILRNLEMDYVICFKAICGRNMAKLKENVTQFIPYQTKRVAFTPAYRDGIVHRATYEAVSRGWFDLTVQDVVIKSCLKAHDTPALGWIGWRRRQVETPHDYMESLYSFLCKSPVFALDLIKFYPDYIFQQYHFHWDDSYDPYWYTCVIQERIKNIPSSRHIDIDRFNQNDKLRPFVHLL